MEVTSVLAGSAEVGGGAQRAAMGVARAHVDVTGVLATGTELGGAAQRAGWERHGRR
jgi:hypothetical protein